LITLEQTKHFTLTELSQFNGKNGKAAYVGYKGKVYDVSDSDLWLEGDHTGHEAGQDLTAQMEIAPHGDEVMQKMKTVGTLV
jgi:predicted heme/steroid binding protein